MSVLDDMISVVDSRSLLKHDFYLAWQAGELKINDLQYYASQYFYHEDNFPRYLSAIHTQCTSPEIRKVILGNLIDEEQGEVNHREQWIRFGESLGMKRSDVIKAKANSNTDHLINEYFRLSNSSIEEGLAALFAYEYQMPKISETKIDGLKKFYNITDERGLEFFKTHMTADEWHSQECADIISAMPSELQKRALEATVVAAAALEKFLDGINEYRLSSVI